MIDYFMTLVSIGFAYSLVPQMILVTKQKKVEIAWQTLIISSLGLWTYTVCFILLDQKLTGITNTLCASCWTYLLIAKIYYKKG